MLGEKGSEAALDAAARAIEVYPSGLEARTIGAIACLRLRRYEEADPAAAGRLGLRPRVRRSDGGVRFALAAVGRTDEAVRRPTCSRSTIPMTIGSRTFGPPSPGQQAREE